MKKIKRQFSLGRLLQNGKVLLVISFIIAISVWLYMSLNTTNETTVTISEIPVQIELSDEAINSGLQIFSGGDVTATITVSGTRATVGSLSQSDISVTAAANIIDSSGTYTLSLSASKVNPYADYQFVSTISPSTVEIYVDYFRESAYTVQDNIVYKVDSGYYASTSLATKKITVSGPAAAVSKISKVAAAANIDGTLSSSTTANADIILYDADGSEIDTELITIDPSTVEASVTVLPEKEVSVTPIFINKPRGLTLTDDILTVEPSTVLIAGAEELLNDIDSVSLEAIDFSTIKNEANEFTLPIDIPSDCRNISNESSAKVTLDFSSYTSDSLTINRFQVQGLSSGYTAEVTQKELEVTVIGPEDEVAKLEPDDVTVIIDASDYDGIVGSVSMNVTFNISGNTSCWVYGAYKANITISESDTG